MNFIFVSYFSAIIGLYLIGLATYINNPKSAVNRYFTLFTFFSGSWQLCLLLADTAQSEQQALWLLRLALAVGTPLGLAFLLFCDVFPAVELRKLKKRTRLLLTLMTAFLSIMSLTPFMLKSIVVGDGWVDVGEVTILYTLQSLFIIVEMGWGIVTIVRRRKTAQALHRAQIRMIAFGAVVATVINTITGIILVYTEAASSISTLLTATSFFIMALFSGSAITRYHMFNVRSVVARAVAYTVSAAIVVAVYGYIAGVIVDTYAQSFVTRILLTGFSMLILLSFFSKLRSVFNRVTNRIFYRESYSSREKLDQLTSKLVASISFDNVVAASLEVLSDALKPESMTVAVKSVGGWEQWGKNLSNNVISIISDQADGSAPGNDLLTVDALTEETLLRQNGIEAVLILQSASDIEGFIVLGPRSSGDIYSRQDNNFLRIAARNIGSAINNAKSYQQIADFNKTLRVKVKEATEELRAKNAELEALHKTKDDFISMASHQLRPKLTASAGFLDLLDATKLKTTKEQAELIGLTREGLQRMTDIVVDMLDISRMDAHEIKLDFGNSSVDIVELVSHEVKTAASSAEPGRFEIVLQPSNLHVESTVDEVKLREVVSNLLSNADQYSPKGTKVRAEISKKDKNFEVRVVDKGIGMTDEEKAKLFTKFYRSETAKQLRPNGSGIGLYMNRKIVEAHGGEMIVESEKGKGSTFGFKIPLKRIHNHG